MTKLVGPTECLDIGERVYHRRADLFGRIEHLADVHGFGDLKQVAFVRYEWPHDGKRLVLVPLDELRRA